MHSHSSKSRRLVPKGRRPRRRTELGLLLIASAIIVAAYVLTSLATKNTIPANLKLTLAATLTLGLVAHLANRWLVPDADPVILPTVIFLNGLGYVMLSRLDPGEARLQAVWTALSVVMYAITLLIIKRSKDLERYRYILVVLGLFLLFLPMIPHIGVDINGARLWIQVGRFTFQPVEAAKLALCAFFASYFIEKKELLSTPTLRAGNYLLPDPRAFGPIVVGWGVAMLIMAAEKDVGFALLIFLMFLTMLWLATGRFGYVVVGVIIFLGATWLGAHLFTQVNVRIVTWLDPWKYAQTTGYQLVQAQYALGWGGLGGTGLGLGHPNLIPVVTSDFIFAAIGEELGLMGTSIVIVAFLVLVGAGIHAGLRARSEFSKLFAVGLTIVLGLQAFFIMAGIVRLLPLTGMTLPFVAYGGSALLANYILIALLMRISHEGNHSEVSQDFQELYDSSLQV